MHQRHAALSKELSEADSFLDLAPQAEALLDELSTALFGDILDEIEANLTHALREILRQDRSVKSRRTTKRKRLNVDFYIDNQGHEEDILKGQGGSVCNILSVSLRFITLSRLDQKQHRPFLVLDEQDCWLRPDLVPVFMSLIAKIAAKLDMQVLVISHHSTDLFATHAERIYTLRPDRDMGVKISLKEQMEREKTL